MNNFVVISSDSSPPSSPFGYAPVNRVSDLCGVDSRLSSPLADSGFSNSCPSEVVATVSASEQVSRPDFPAREASPVKNKFAGNGGRYNFHFISDSEDEGTGQGTNGLDFGDETDTRCLQFDKKENYLKENKNAPKEERKEFKAKEKAEKAALLEKYRQMKPGECLKYVTVNVDIQLLDIDMCSKAIDLLKQQGIINCKITQKNESNCISWSRNMPGSSDDQEKYENFILYVWSSERLITSIKYCTLVDTFMAITKTSPDLKISLVIYGLGNYYRKMNKLKKPENHSNPLEMQKRKGRKRKSDESSISRSQIEMALAELEVILRISNRIIENHEDFALFIHQFTKSVSEIEYRKEIEKRDNERSWFARGDSRDCVRIDKDMNGLSRLWLQQLCQFNKATIDAAKAIIDVYHTPLCLYEAYEHCSSQKEKELLLQNIQIKRSGGSQAICRKIGPELSRKLYLMFTQSDGNILLSKD